MTTHLVSEKKVPLCALKHCDHSHSPGHVAHQSVQSALAGLVLPIWAANSKSPPANVCMQLDLMTKIRDNKIYENRAHFQKHAAQPLNFSSFQIQEYLKASAFRWQPAPCLLSNLCIYERMCPWDIRMSVLRHLPLCVHGICRRTL